MWIGSMRQLCTSSTTSEVGELKVFRIDHEGFTDILQVAPPPMSISSWLMLDVAEEVAAAAAEVVDAIIPDMLVILISIDIELDMMDIRRIVQLSIKQEMMSTSLEKTMEG